MNCFFKALSVIVFFFLFAAFRIEVNNPNLRPFRIYIEPLQNNEAEKIYSHIVSN